MAHYEIDPIVEFSRELHCITDPYYLGLVAGALDKIPDYFWFAPASASGKYHPTSSLGLGGLVRHVKGVFWIGEELLRHPIFGAKFTESEKNEIRVALLLHDGCKQGEDNTGTHTEFLHPLLVKNALNPMDDIDYVSEATPEEIKKDLDTWDRICDLIETHMGPWTADREGNELLKPPTTEGQLFVHMCDYLASRKIIEVDVANRSAQSNYSGNKEEPATDRQVEYVTLLMNKTLGSHGCPIKKIKITDDKGVRIYTKKQAGKDIQTLKDFLGIK